MKAEVFLRELASDDVGIINSWRSDKELINKLGAGFRYIDKSVDNDWIESYFNNRSSNVRLAICEKSTKKLVGAVYLVGINWVNRNCEFAIMIGDPDFRGQGIGSYATNQALMHAFDDLNLHRVTLTVLESNKAAISLYSKIGFKKEGVLRDSAYKSGAYYNMVTMALLKSEFQK